jgi:hypothetical protein
MIERRPSWPPKSVQVYVEQLLTNPALQPHCHRGLLCFLTQNEEMRLAYETVLKFSVDSQCADQFFINAVDCFTDCWLPQYVRKNDYDEWLKDLDNGLLDLNKRLVRVPATDHEEDFPFLKLDSLMDEILEHYGNEIALEQFKSNPQLRKALNATGVVSLLEAMRKRIALSVSQPRIPLWKSELGYETPREIKGARERLFIRRLKTLMADTFTDMQDRDLRHSVARVANTLFDTDRFSAGNVSKIH